MRLKQLIFLLIFQLLSYISFSQAATIKSNEINDLRNEIVNLKKDNNNLLGQIQILKESLTNLEKYLRGNNFDLNQSIEKLNKAIGDLSNKLSETRNGVQNSIINNKEVQNLENSNTKDKIYFVVYNIIVFFRVY